MALSNMEIFNQYYMPVLVEKTAQKTAGLVEASRGAMVISSEGVVGSLAETSFYRSLAASVHDVDMSEANGDVDPDDLSQDKFARVKMAGRFGPVAYEPSQMAWLQKPTSEAIDVFTESMTDGLIAMKVNRMIAAAKAAITNQSSATHDISATAGIDYRAMNAAYAKFGDASDRIVCNVITGAVYHKLIDKNLSSAAELFTAGSVQVVELLGRPYIVTDSPHLLIAGTPAKDVMLGLTAGAVTISDDPVMTTLIQDKPGKRISTIFQADFIYTLGVKGYGWNTAVEFPVGSDISTGSNWIKKLTSIKDTAGVALIADSTK